MGKSVNTLISYQVVEKACKKLIFHPRTFSHLINQGVEDGQLTLGGRSHIPFQGHQVFFYIFLTNLY